MWFRLGLVWCEIWFFSPTLVESLIPFTSVGKITPNVSPCRRGNCLGINSQSWVRAPAAWLRFVCIGNQTLLWDFSGGGFEICSSLNLRGSESAQQSPIVVEVDALWGSCSERPHGHKALCLALTSASSSGRVSLGDCVPRGYKRSPPRLLSPVVTPGSEDTAASPAPSFANSAPRKVLGLAPAWLFHTSNPLLGKGPGRPGN